MLKREVFGTVDGEPVELITLSNRLGMQVVLLTYGASIRAVHVPDREGRLGDVALAPATWQDYLDKPQYFGPTVGRVANRIAGGRFVLDGVEYRVPVNNGPNSLHGGSRGFDKVNWAIVAEGPGAMVTLRHVSLDGDQGFPGELKVTATYRLDEAENRLSLDYAATTDRPTIVNLSSHAYWNLAGDGAAAGAMGHRLTMKSDHYLPTDASSIPTGEIRPVAGTAFDFREPTEIGARVRDGSDEQIRFGRGYDHNWVVDRDIAAEPRLMARLEDPASGRVMELLSDQPGLQFYSGNFFDAGTVGKAGRLYRMGDGVALEPQMFPDTPNQPAFGSIRLAPGGSYRNRMVWRFSAR
ncbi:aldose epimerase family protein [Sphingosinicella terrae]|uniref:aldose epimerase family protein n=1 Tax=Sphingosinicella terrae TaxID=2172047 RepID=UPI000E0D97F1|nr:aldose epimerase family protein [Sphingosinicella terrae]